MSFDSPSLIRRLQTSYRGAMYMIGDESTHSRTHNIAASLEPGEALGSVLDDVRRAAMMLTAAIFRLAYASAAGARTELERALSRAASFVQALPEGTWKTDTQRDLHEMRSAMTRLLTIAPVPSSAAVEAREAGDETLWRQEERGWIETRRASRSVPKIPRQRFERATRPGTPSALRADRESAVAAPSRTRAPAFDPSSSPSPTRRTHDDGRRLSMLIHAAEVPWRGVLVRMMKFPVLVVARLVRRLTRRQRTRDGAVAQPPQAEGRANLPEQG